MLGYQYLHCFLFGIWLSVSIRGSFTVQQCPSGMFQCDSVTRSTCIPNKWTCDGERDCNDNSDEDPELCARPQCNQDEFMCKTKWCISLSLRCNGVNDCGDNSDELCNQDQCGMGDFRCADGEFCIPKMWQCDGIWDCKDGSDEAGCTAECGTGYHSCGYRLKGPICYSASQRCDGVSQCEHGMDEIGCPTTPPSPTCLRTQFSCGNDKCIPLNKVCDLNNDCGNNADEEARMCADNPCENERNPCQHICTYNREHGQHCVCKLGYRLRPDNISCEDIDECGEQLASCSQICSNSVGNYSCSCAEGYTSVPSSPNLCKAMEGEPTLIVASRGEITEMKFRDREALRLVNNTLAAVAVDIDVRRNILYWSRVQNPAIVSVQLNENHTKTVATQETLIQEDIQTPDGLALDWVHRNLYWTDTDKQTVEVVSLDNGLRTTLVRDYIDKPRAIVVDPRDDEGPFMYWTDWGQQPKIAKAGLDGSRQQSLVTEDIHWPNGLAIDFVQNLVYWVDPKLEYISSVDLQGGRRRLVSTMSGYHKAFSVDVFQNAVFYSDWYTESIYRVDYREHPNVSELVMKRQHRPYGIKMLHALRQLAATDRCQGVTVCPPSALCLPSPAWPGYNCVCSDHPPNDADNCVSGVNITSTEAPGGEILTEDEFSAQTDETGTRTSTSGTEGPKCVPGIILLTLILWTFATRVHK